MFFRIFSFLFTKTNNSLTFLLDTPPKPMILRKCMIGSGLRALNSKENESINIRVALPVPHIMNVQTFLISPVVCKHENLI